ncbi:MAG: hypothetical protein ABJF01_05330 [bacterium]
MMVLLVAALIVVGAAATLVASPALRTGLLQRERWQGFLVRSGPLTVLIAPATEMDIGAGSLARFNWTVPVAQPNCHLTGHVEVTSGGSKDVRVFVVAEGDYKNLTDGHAVRTYLSSDTTTLVNLNIQLNTPGPMVLAIANPRSAHVAKRVQLRDVKATCV